MSPIKLTDHEKVFDSMDECCSSAIEFALLLPQLSDDGLNKEIVRVSLNGVI